MISVGSSIPRDGNKQNTPNRPNGPTATTCTRPKKESFLKDGAATRGFPKVTGRSYQGLDVFLAEGSCPRNAKCIRQRNQAARRTINEKDSATRGTETPLFASNHPQPSSIREQPNAHAVVRRSRNEEEYSQLHYPVRCRRTASASRAALFEMPCGCIVKTVGWVLDLGRSPPSVTSPDLRDTQLYELLDGNDLQHFFGWSEITIRKFQWPIHHTLSLRTQNTIENLPKCKTFTDTKTDINLNASSARQIACVRHFRPVKDPRSGLRATRRNLRA